MQHLVRAATDPPPHATWPLTAFDKANLLLVLRGTWVFPHPLDGARLREGLARVLVHYPHLAGRVKGGTALALSNAGVPFTEVERPDLQVAHLHSRPALAGQMSNPLHKNRVRKGREAPLTVRLTRLADGTVLGIRCSHGCMDGSAFFGFMERWARTCVGQPFTAPVLDPSLLPVASGRSKAQVRREALDAGWSALSLPGLFLALPNLWPSRLLQRLPPLHFSPEALQSLTDRVRQESGCPGISTQEALAAVLAWLSPSLHGIPPGTPCRSVLVADARERHRALPASFVGNAAFILPGARYAAGASLGEVAALGHRELAPFRGRPSPAMEVGLQLAVDTVAHGLWMMPYDVAAMHRTRATLTYFNSFARAPVYALDFGGGPPSRVIPHDLPDPYLVWPAPPDRGGLELYLTGVAARAALGRPAWWDALASFGGTRP